MNFPDEITIHTVIDGMYDESFVMPPHSHFPLEICYCTDGIIKLEYISANGSECSAQITAHQFFLVKPRTIHKIRMLRPSKMLMAELGHNSRDDIISYIKNSNFAAPFPSLQNFFKSIKDVAVLSDTACVNQTLYDLIVLSSKTRNNETDEFSYYDYDIILKKLLIEICRCNTEMKKYRGNKYVSFTMRFICANYQKSLSLDSIAAFAGISSGYLQKLFRETYGKTVISMLIDYRIQKACELLKQTDYGINVIAKNVGYTNFRSFLSAFTKIVGITPTEYRDKNAENAFIYDYGSNTTAGKFISSIEIPKRYSPPRK